MNKNFAVLSVLLLLLFVQQVAAQTFTQTNGSTSSCSGNFYDSGGQSGNYSDGEFSTYTICSNAGNCVSVNFTAFDLESGFDDLTIYDGPSAASTLIGTYTGTNSPGNVVSSTGCLTFVFSSDLSVTYSGWSATISCATCGGGGGCLPNISTCTANTCSGNFYDSGGSAGVYAANENYTQTICSNAGSCVSVTFTSFDLESCCDDLVIYDGPNTSSPIIGTYTGTASPGTISSTSGCLTFVFTSDLSIQYSGWAATISCSPCAGGGCLPNMGNCTDNACSGNFYDSGGSAANYSDNESFTHTICSNAGNCIQVDFTSFNIENGFDFLTVYDGGSTATPVLGTYTGNVSPGTVVGSTGCLTFVFTSDGSISSTGWTSNVSCITCPAVTGCLINPISNSHGLPPGFTQACDDLCSSSNIPLGFTYDICGSSFTSMYVNMNGNITFGATYTTFTPIGMPNNSTAVMVAPFWSDVDTRSCGTVYYQNGGTHAIVTWYQVGYYSSNCDKTNTYQVILSNGTDPIINIGNNTAFFYGEMQWTAGDITGIGGFGGAPGTAGVNANDGINYSAIGRFDHSGIDYDGPDLTTDGVDYLDNRCFRFPAGGCTVLPFEFLKVESVILEDSYIELQWSTNTDHNNAGFEVERSLNALDFEKIEFVEGLGQQGFTLIQYAYPDRNVERDTDYYYRLKQLDLNGEFTYSPVVHARITDATATVTNAYPNPINDQVSFMLTPKQAGECEIRIVNQLGQLMHREVRAVSRGSQTLNIDVNAIAGGTYFLHISVDGEEVSVQKLIK